MTAGFCLSRLLPLCLPTSLNTPRQKKALKKLPTNLKMKTNWVPAHAKIKKLKDWNFEPGNAVYFDVLARFRLGFSSTDARLKL